MVPHLWFMVSCEGPFASGVMADFIFEAPFSEIFHEIPYLINSHFECLSFRGIKYGMLMKHCISK